VVEIAQNLFSTRRGSLLVGVGAALLAGIVLFVYLQSYRNSVKSASSAGPVLVAKNLIPKGTSGDIIASTEQYQVADLPKSELKTGAIADPATLAGRIALTDIYPRQQLSAADFSLPGVDVLTNHIMRNERAISVPIDPAHSVNNQLANGDHIDIFIGLNARSAAGSQPIIKLLMQDVTLLRAPLGNIATLKVTERQAATLAWAVDNGRLWFVLRPTTGATTPNPGFISANSLLGLKPVR
jgi:pilus assembly protein CpaB